MYTTRYQLGIQIPTSDGEYFTQTLWINYPNVQQWYSQSPYIGYNIKGFWRLVDSVSSAGYDLLITDDIPDRSDERVLLLVDFDIWSGEYYQTNTGSSGEAVFLYTPFPIPNRFTTYEVIQGDHYT